MFKWFFKRRPEKGDLKASALSAERAACVADVVSSWMRSATHEKGLKSAVGFAVKNDVYTSELKKIVVLKVIELRSPTTTLSVAGVEGMCIADKEGIKKFNRTEAIEAIYKYANRHGIITKLVNHGSNYYLKILATNINQK